ncbi:SRPBCC domain-containing protein [uncultured Ruegeria sp.]|uniref:SRPBCC family protein n=1 Tax=uncultured Ruegeria sp. TaxID=259304 RepID=UPI002621CF67|nr:SRPBCC domain-containing protein [uncultured Ruegeria sp.]
MTDAVLQKTIFLRAEPETVWAYLTEPDRLAEWFHKPERPLAQGQKLEMFGTTSGDLLIWGEVRVAQPPKYLEYTFTVKPMGEAVSVVKWTLDPVAGGTRLGLQHEGLPQGAEAFGLILALDNGWDEHFGKMRTALHETVDA